MPDRKQFVGAENKNPALLKLLEQTRNKPVTEEELHEQRVSFAFGNALGLATPLITKDSVRQASQNISLRTRG